MTCMDQNEDTCITNESNNQWRVRLNLNARTGIFREMKIDSMAADALAPSVAKSQVPWCYCVYIKVATV